MHVCGMQSLQVVCVACMSDHQQEKDISSPYQPCFLQVILLTVVRLMARSGSLVVHSFAHLIALLIVFELFG